MKFNVKNMIIVIELITILFLLTLISVYFFENSTVQNNMETEKKWLIKVEDIPYDLSKANKYEIVQTYLNFSPEMRVRNINDGEFYVLTIKRDTKSLGLVREEYEILLNQEEYNNLLAKQEGNTIKKTRYQLENEDGLIMAIDIFSGELEGLAYLEIEFKDKETAENYGTPDWVIQDVTTDLDYKNGHLSRYGIPNSFYEYMK